MMKRRRILILTVALLAACRLQAEQPAPVPATDIQGSYWYVFDHVTDVADDAEIVLLTTLPPDHGSQRIKLKNIYPTPERIVEDQDRANRLVVWKVRPAAGQEQIYFRIDFEGRIGMTLNDVDPAAVRAADIDSGVERYQEREEPWLKTEGVVSETAREVVGDQENPYLQARLIFDWMIRNMEFVPGGFGEKGAVSSLTARRGDCGQMSRVFAAMCRALGIPARTVTNVWLDGGLHRYAEFYVEPHGWLPVDVTAAQALVPEYSVFDDREASAFRRNNGIPVSDHTWLFGNLYSNHMILTVGNNISLPADEGRKPVVYRSMEPGGVNANPAAVSIHGLNDDIVHGGFYVFGPQIDFEEAHHLAHQKLAHQFFKVGLYDVVERDCLSTGDREQDSVTHWINLGRVKLHKGEYDRAEACFRRALLSEGGNPTEVVGSRIWAYNYLGNCYDLMQRRELAVAEYERVLELAIDARGALAYARLYLEKPFSLSDNELGAGPR